MSVKLTVDLLAAEGGLPVNCRICRGQLLPAFAPVNLGGNAPKNVMCVGYSAGSGRFLLTNGSHVYVSTDGAYCVQIAPYGGFYPFFIQDITPDRIRAVMISCGNALYHTGLEYSTFFLGALLYCGTMHCGRLFGAGYNDRYKLHWSGREGFRDWEPGIGGSGYVRLDPKRGGIVDLVEYGEYLIAVREWGLTVLCMYGVPENFSVKLTDTDTDRIFHGSANVVSGNLLFYTESGLHSFDGSSIKRLTHRYDGDIYDTKCSAEYGGRYFLICKSKSLGGGAIFCYDPSDGESYLIPAETNAMCTGADGVYFYDSNGANVLRESGEFTFGNGKIDFGTSRRKTVTEIYVDSDGVDVEISNGRISRKFTNARGIIRPRLRGENFEIKLSGSNPVYGLKAKAEVCGEI